MLVTPIYIFSWLIHISLQMQLFLKFIWLTGFFLKQNSPVYFKKQNSIPPPSFSPPSFPLLFIYLIYSHGSNIKQKMAYSVKTPPMPMSCLLSSYPETHTTGNPSLLVYPSPNYFYAHRSQYKCIYMYVCMCVHIYIKYTYTHM